MSNAHIEAQRPTVDNVCTMLGIPVEDRSMVAGWAANLSQGVAFESLRSYVDVMVADRCWRITDDLLSKLILEGVGGMDLTSDEIFAAVVAMPQIAQRNESRNENTTPRT